MCKQKNTSCTAMHKWPGRCRQAFCSCSCCLHVASACASSGRASPCAAWWASLTAFHKEILTCALAYTQSWPCFHSLQPQSPSFCASCALASPHGRVSVRAYWCQEAAQWALLKETWLGCFHPGALHHGLGHIHLGSCSASLSCHHSHCHNSKVECRRCLQNCTTSTILRGHQVCTRPFPGVGADCQIPPALASPGGRGMITPTMSYSRHWSGVLQPLCIGPWGRPDSPEHVRRSLRFLVPPALRGHKPPGVLRRVRTLLTSAAPIDLFHGWLANILFSPLLHCVERPSTSPSRGKAPSGPPWEDSAWVWASLKPWVGRASTLARQASALWSGKPRPIVVPGCPGSDCALL